MPPTGDLAQTQACVLDLELNQQLFGSQASAQSTEPHKPGPYSYFLKMALMVLQRMIGRFGKAEVRDWLGDYCSNSGAIGGRWT